MPEEYKPGDKVPKSGIYLVTHDSHTKPYEVTCIKDKIFHHAIHARTQDFPWSVQHIILTTMSTLGRNKIKCARRPRWTLMLVTP
jgi:hypothetical protein